MASSLEGEGGTERRVIDSIIAGNVSLRLCLLWVFGDDQNCFERLMGHTSEKISHVDNVKGCDKAAVSDLYKTSPKEVFAFLRRVIRQEGIRIVGSSTEQQPHLPGTAKNIDKSLDRLYIDSNDDGSGFANTISEAAMIAPSSLDSKDWPSLPLPTVVRKPASTKADSKSRKNKKRLAPTLLSSQSLNGNIKGGDTEKVNSIFGAGTDESNKFGNKGSVEGFSPPSFSTAFAPVNVLTSRKKETDRKTPSPKQKVEAQIENAKLNARPISPDLKFESPSKRENPRSSFLTPLKIKIPRSTLTPSSGGTGDSFTPPRDFLSPSPERGLLSPVPNISSSVTKSRNRHVYNPAVFRLAMLCAAGVLAGYVSDLAAELHFLVRLLTVADRGVTSSPSKHDSSVFDATRYLNSPKECRYFSGVSLWALKAITLNLGTVALKNIGGNSTVIMMVSMFRDDIKDKLEEVGRQKPDSLVQLTSASNRTIHDKIWNANPQRYKANDYGKHGKTVFNNRKKSLDTFCSLLRKYQNHTQGFSKDSKTEMGWKISFSAKCRDCLQNTMPCNYPWLALEFLKQLCEMESSDQRNEDFKTLEKKNYKTSKSKMAFFENRMKGRVTRYTSGVSSTKGSGSYRKPSGNPSKHSNSRAHKRGNNNRNHHGNQVGPGARHAFSYGYVSNDNQKDSMVAEEMFTPSQRFFLYFLLNCDSHRFMSHVRTVALAKIKELTEPIIPGDILVGFDQRILHAKVLARFLGFVLHSMFWSVGLDHAFDKSVAKEALLSSIDSLVTLVNKTEPAVNLMTHLRWAWEHGRLVGTVPWVAQYIRTLKYDMISKDSNFMKSTCIALSHIRHFALRNLCTPPGLLVVTCIDKLSLSLRWECLRPKLFNDQCLGDIRGFEHEQYGSAVSPNSLQLDLNENLIDGVMFEKSCEDFEFLVLLLRKHKLARLSPTPPGLSSSRTLDADTLMKLASSTPMMLRRSSSITKTKVAPTTLWEDAAHHSMSFSFFKQHESLREVADYVVTKAVKNSITMAKTWLVPETVKRFTSYTGAQSLQNQKTIESNLVSSGMKYANAECDKVVKRSLPALAPPEYFDVEVGDTKNRVPSSVLKAAMRLASKNARSQLKQMLGTALVAEFRTQIIDSKKPQKSKKGGRCPRPRKNEQIRNSVEDSIHWLGRLSDTVTVSPLSLPVQRSFGSALNRVIAPFFNSESFVATETVYVRLQHLLSDKLLYAASSILSAMIENGSVWTSDGPYRFSCLLNIFAFVCKANALSFTTKDYPPLASKWATNLLLKTSTAVVEKIVEADGKPIKQTSKFTEPLAPLKVAVTSLARVCLCLNADYNLCNTQSIYLVHQTVARSFANLKNIDTETEIATKGVRQADLYHQLVHEVGRGFLKECGEEIC